MNNTIILLKGEALLTRGEYKKFNKGDTIFGNDSNPEELKRWSIEQEQEAKEELAKYACTYHENIETWSIEEYAIEYCECDEDGELVQGSDYDLAVDVNEMSERIFDLLTSTYGGLTEKKQKEMEEYPDLYINDYTRQMCEDNSVFDENIISKIMGMVEDDFTEWLQI